MWKEKKRNREKERDRKRETVFHFQKHEIKGKQIQTKQDAIIIFLAEINEELHPAQLDHNQIHLITDMEKH